MGCMHWCHFRATIFRRFVILKRNLKAFITSVVLSLIFSGIAILAQYLMKTLAVEDTSPVTFKTFSTSTNEIYVINTSWSGPYVDILTEMYYNDTGVYPNITYFNNRTALNEKMYNDRLYNTGPRYVKMGVQFIATAPYYQFIEFYNGSLYTRNLYDINIQITRMAWKATFGKQYDFHYSDIKLLKKLMDLIFGYVGPMLIVCGLISIIPTIISQPITDNTGEVRSYMESCSLTLFPYWAATFLLDLALWVVLVTIVWAIFIAFQVKSFTDNLLNTWYIFVMTGPGLIMSVYCISFIFSNAESAARNAFMIFILFLLVPMIVDMVVTTDLPMWTQWIYAIIPHIGTERLLTACMLRIGYYKEDLSYYWKQSSIFPQLLMQIPNFFIYTFILWLIETLKKVVYKKNAEITFGSYTEFFKEKKHNGTEETLQMEEDVEASHDYAVRVEKVSRLFFNTAGDPIPAVNCVSLGVKKGSIFGFLGANGAGKTTLIKMITSMLPPSSGKIEVNGVDISLNRDTTQISICPQFNSHLCAELTPVEHFRLYKDIFQMDDESAEKRTKQLLEILEINQYKDKPVREMSGGQQRKLAVALSFLGPAQIVLLDEPTSSLDPYARHTVHELINEFKGVKTFMLCTHMLSEAEMLCDTISIMVKGNIYTIGSPQYLSSKFGTEYKIDVLQKDENDEEKTKLDCFFSKMLSDAKATIIRPKARLYSIPSQGLALSSLFEIMENGKEGDNGFNYYTCSSSSLERVFMEIVRMSEGEETDYTKLMP